VRELEVEKTEREIEDIVNKQNILFESLDLKKKRVDE
jgi:uncharacterized protein YoxC